MPCLPKGQLEAGNWIRNLAINLRDFGARHTLQYLRWAWRYPRERLISVLPSLLNNSFEVVPGHVAVPLAMPLHADWPCTVEHYLRAWERYA